MRRFAFLRRRAAPACENRRVPAAVMMSRPALALLALLTAAPAAAAGAADAAAVSWWIWPAALFAVSFAIGIVGVLAGVGGGVLFVPIVGGFFPFHLDFVRAAGLLLALSGALSAAPGLLRSGMASMRLAMPLALVGSVTSIAGALLGLALPTQVVQAALGVTILAIVLLMWRAQKSEYPEVPAPDALSAALQLHGVFHDPAAGRDVHWRVHRMPMGLAAFAGIGLLAGLFGLGAGWANVPVLNLMMGAPLKLAVGTSGFVLSVVDTSAAWVYLNRGAVLPVLVAPSIIGVMLGAKIGARLLRVVRASTVRRVVIWLLLAAGTRALLKGLGIWN
jgi:uncharacterized membrane protein YfcA